MQTPSTPMPVHPLYPLGSQAGRGARAYDIHCTEAYNPFRSPTKEVPLFAPSKRDNQELSNRQEQATSGDNCVCEDSGHAGLSCFLHPSFS